MTVFVIQNQQRRDGDGQLRDVYDYSPAEEFGEIEFLLSPTAAPWSPEPVIAELREKLSGFSQDDYLLLSGNPVLMALASMIAADEAGTVNFLQWHGRDRRYIPVTAEIWLD